MSLPLRVVSHSLGSFGTRTLQGAVSSHCRPLSGRRRTFFAASSQSALLNKKCVPCEPDRGSLGFMGLCEAMDRSKAESMLASDAEGWELAEDEENRLKIKRTWRTKNFLKALELCERFAEVAEAENHHPDLHVTGWNRLTVELTTHSREGLTENDFIMAAKLNAVPMEDLLSKKKAAAS